MSYELSFGGEFFYNEGEPYDGGPEPSRKPTSVWQAIVSCAELEPTKWEMIATEFGIPPMLLTAEQVFERIEKTGTCSNLDSPVEVWIDPNGWLTLSVYDK